MVRRAFSSLALMTGVVLLLAGCTQAQSTDAPGGETIRRLRVSGSGTALPLVRILTDAYEADNVEFVYLPGLHSGGGVKGVANGDLEIGTVSRDLEPDEEALGLKLVKLADDGLVVAVHPSVTIDGLTSEQVREVYRGEHQNWSELGGPDLGIVILDRNEDESAKIILREYVLGSDLAITGQAVNMFYEPDMIEGLRSTAGAVGYFSLGYGLSEQIPVRYLKLDGVEASVENIVSGDYKMVRPLGVVVDEPSGAAIEAFLEWVQSDEARELMTEKGFAPPLNDSGE